MRPSTLHEQNSMPLQALRLLLLLLAFSLSSATQAETDSDDPPRVIAALEQGLAAELGKGIRRNLPLALTLYCDAGSMGSSEGFFRIGRILKSGPSFLRNPKLANAYFALAARLGHHASLDQFDESVPSELLEDECGNFAKGLEEERFDADGYVAGLAVQRRKVAQLILLHAPKFGVNVRVAMAIALAESNLNPNALSPKNAQGVMQLIPATAERFGVKNAFDAESNIRGGLAYLKWLSARFNGDWALVAAAYNAGEGNVDKYRGIPPFKETQQYVRRVLFFAGFPPPDQS